MSFDDWLKNIIASISMEYVMSRERSFDLFSKIMKERTRDGATRHTGNRNSKGNR